MVETGLVPPLQMMRHDIICSYYNIAQSNTCNRTMDNWTLLEHAVGQTMNWKMPLIMQPYGKFGTFILENKWWVFQMFSILFENAKVADNWTLIKSVAHFWMENYIFCFLLQSTYERHGILNHWQLGCLFNRLLRLITKKHESSLLLAFVRGIHLYSLTKGVQVDYPHKGPILWKSFPCHYIIMGDYCYHYKISVSKYHIKHGFYMMMTFQNIWKYKISKNCVVFI